MILIQTYQKIFGLIVPDPSKLKSNELGTVHTHLLTVITTGALMWAYAFIAYFTIDNPWPARVGFTASIVHLFSPFLYRFNTHALLNASVLLFAGLLHQSTFSYFTGGFMDRIIIWFGILPFLGAIIAGKKGAIMWCLITLFASGSFLLLHLNGHSFPNLISDTGRLFSQISIVFGWIFLSSILSFTYLFFQEKQNEILNRQKSHIENLFRILFHDLGTPLTLLQMSLDVFDNSIEQKQKDRSIQTCRKAVDSMTEITENVREMYRVQEISTKIDCVYHSLNKAVAQLEILFQNQLKNKNISLVYDPVLHQGTQIYVEPVSFLHQVMANIISNSIKFSHDHAIIKIQASPLNENFILINIQDQGQGMTDEQLAHFKSNEINISHLGTRGEKGSGFGLNLMKNFIEKYGGEVCVTSCTQGNSRGTTFQLKLRGHFA